MMSLQSLAKMVVYRNAAYTGRPGERTLVEILVLSAKEQGMTITEDEAWELIDEAMVEISKRL